MHVILLFALAGTIPLISILYDKISTDKNKANWYRTFLLSKFVANIVVYRAHIYTVDYSG